MLPSLTIRQERDLAALTAALRAIPSVVKAQYLADPVVVAALLASIGTTLQLPPGMIANLPHYDVIERAVAKRWWGESVFNEDEHFSDERFALITARWDGGFRNPHPKTWLAAAQQLARMYQAGRVRTTYVARFVDNLFRMVKEAAPIDLTAILIMHDPTYWTFVNTYMAQLRRGVRGDIWLTVEYLEQVTARIPALYAELFHRLWLPATLSTQEYAAVRDTPTALLRELYPDVWMQGYNLYHTQVNKTAAHPTR